jgi:hypothetical protein
VLRVGVVALLGLDVALEILDGEVGGDIDRQQVTVGRVALAADGYCYAWPIRALVSRVPGRVAQERFRGSSHGCGRLEPLLACDAGVSSLGKKCGTVC